MTDLSLLRLSGPLLKGAIVSYYAKALRILCMPA